MTFQTLVNLLHLFLGHKVKGSSDDEIDNAKFKNDTDGIGERVSCFHPSSEKRKGDKARKTSQIMIDSRFRRTSQAKSGCGC